MSNEISRNLWIFGLGRVFKPPLWPLLGGEPPDRRVVRSGAGLLAQHPRGRLGARTAAAPALTKVGLTHPRGKTAIVLGASKGIGRACTQTLAQEGCSLAAHRSKARSELMMQLRLSVKLKKYAVAFLRKQGCDSAAGAIEPGGYAGPPFAFPKVPDSWCTPNRLLRWVRPEEWSAQNGIVISALIEDVGKTGGGLHDGVGKDRDFRWVA